MGTKATTGHAGRPAPTKASYLAERAAAADPRWVIHIHRTGRCRPDAAHPYFGQAYYCIGSASTGFFLFLCGFSTWFSFFDRFSSFILSKYIYIFGKCSNSKIVQI
jgi:hypothetical protein